MPECANDEMSKTNKNTLFNRKYKKHDPHLTLQYGLLKRRIHGIGNQTHCTISKIETVPNGLFYCWIQMWNEMIGVSGHDSALEGYTGPGTTWVNGMNLVMNHAPWVTDEWSRTKGSSTRSIHWPTDVLNDQDTRIRWTCSTLQRHIHIFKLKAK